MSAFFGVPGPLEILIILFILGILVLPVVLLVVILASGSKRRSPPPTTATCPRCGGWLAAQAKFCHHCGTAIAPPQSPFKQ